MNVNVARRMIEFLTGAAERAQQIPDSIFLPEFYHWHRCD